ncbi:MAG: high-affinity branched-chain amino acid ABC transporter ATP-binding protein LivG, partial [Betaproteobacteria bacterium]
ILLIEHDMKLVMSVCDRVLVLDYGRKIAEDTASVVQNDPKVVAAYLGGEVSLNLKGA